MIGMRPAAILATPGGGREGEGGRGREGGGGGWDLKLVLEGVCHTMCWHLAQMTNATILYCTLRSKE